MMTRCVICALQLVLEHAQAEAAAKMMASEAWKEYERVCAEAFARYDAALASLEAGEVDTSKERR